MVAAQHTGFWFQFLTGSAAGRMGAMFTEDELRGELTAWQTTPKYMQETERRGGGTRHTRPGCPDTVCES